MNQERYEESHPGVEEGGGDSWQFSFCSPRKSVSRRQAGSCQLIYIFLPRVQWEMSHREVQGLGS